MQTCHGKYGQKYRVLMEERKMAGQYMIFTFNPHHANPQGKVVRNLYSRVDHDPQSYHAKITWKVLAEI
jgi:hypothetical protein